MRSNQVFPMIKFQGQMMTKPWLRFWQLHQLLREVLECRNHEVLTKDWILNVGRPNTRLVYHSPSCWPTHFAFQWTHPTLGNWLRPLNFLIPLQELRGPIMCWGHLGWCAKHHWFPLQLWWCLIFDKLQYFEWQPHYVMAWIHQGWWLHLSRIPMRSYSANHQSIRYLLVTYLSTTYLLTYLWFHMLMDYLLARYLLANHLLWWYYLGMPQKPNSKSF